MNDLNWEKVETIIDEVLHLPEDQRESYIDEKCGGNKKLKSEVTELLESIFESEGWLEDPEVYKHDFYKDLSVEEFNLNVRSLIDKKIGSYTIREKIGEGGMGSVFLGERTDGEFEHRVAIKIIRHGYATEQNLLRFRREQRILAGMNHAGIARLFDGGVTDDGYPYIIMEYIDGTPITEYCRENNCSMDEKITLFIKVLEAVQHAHENLAIHRDLKPGNILVTEEGSVKILDFGISKLLEEDNSLSITRTGAQLLTLKYAAPEQIRQGNINTSTDLYSLGVVFYELMTGDVPFNLEEKTRYESEQVILNESPAKPSSRVTSNQQKNKLSGDLDAIALKAIRKEPEKRYRVANEFLNELKNYQKGLPVSARNDTLQYRSQKFFKRNKSAITVAIGIVLLTIGFTVFYTWNITQERNRARVEAERAEEVTEFMVNILQENNPDENPIDELTVAAALDQGIERLENSDISPINRATILGTIAQIKINLGEYEEAQNLIDQAMPIVLDSLSVQNKNTSSVPLIQGQLAYIQSEFDKAEQSLEISDSLFKAHSLTNTSDYLNLKFNMVGFYNSQSHYNNSLRTLEELNPETFGTDEEAMEKKSNYFNYLALAQKNLGKYEEAVKNYQTAIEFREEVYGAENPETATAMNNLANVYIQIDQFKEALELSEKAHQIRYEVYGPDHYLTGSTFNTQSVIYKNLNRYEEALEYAELSYQANRNSLGEDHIRSILTARSVSDVLRLMQRYEEAKEYIQMAVEGVDENYPHNDTFRGRVYHTNAQLYHDMGEFETAEKYYKESLELYKSGVGEYHPYTADALLHYSSMEMDRKNYVKAEQLLNRSLANFKANGNSAEDRISEADSLLAEIKSSAGNR